MRLNRTLKEKRREYKQSHEKVILQHENARPHVDKSVKSYFESLKWEFILQPPHSPRKLLIPITDCQSI